MKKYCGIFILSIFLNLFSQQAFAYIDPGTTGAIFSSLIPYLLMILSVTFGFFIWPFRRFYRWLSKWSGGRKWLTLLLSTAIILIVMGIVAVVSIWILF